MPTCAPPTKKNKSSLSKSSNSSSNKSSAKPSTTIKNVKQKASNLIQMTHPKKVKNTQNSVDAGDAGSTASHPDSNVTEQHKKTGKQTHIVVNSSSEDSGSEGNERHLKSVVTMEVDF